MLLSLFCAVLLSTVVTSQVDPPKFEQGNNVTILKEFIPEYIAQVVATLSGANPQNTSLVITSDSMNTTDVVHKREGNSWYIIFKHPIVSNRGNYTFSATNDGGTTNLTYRIFVGEIPDNFHASCENTILPPKFFVNCNFNDDSDAPATGVIISLPGLIEDKLISFETIPVQHLTHHEVVTTDLRYVISGFYTLTVTAINQINNVTVFNSTFYIDRLYANVYINATSDTVKEYDNFTFTCSASTDMNVTFNISIDNSTTGDKHTRLIAGTNEDNSQNFTFIDTTYLDDDTTFVCIVNDTWKSSILSMSVLYPPVFPESTEAVSYNGSNVILITYMRANPPVTSFSWEFNGNPLSNTSRIHIINATTIQFTPVTQDDIGNYTVIANNTEGSGEGMIGMDVYLYSSGSPTSSMIPMTSITPTAPNSKKSHVAAILAGILVPLFVIVLIVIFGVLFYYRRKRRAARIRFIPLNDEDEPLM